MIRLFVGLPIPPEIAAQIEPLQRGVPGAKWRNRHQFHITLAFIGSFDERFAQELDSALGAIAVAPFAISLKGAGLFGAARPDALWFGVQAPESLTILHNRVKRAVRDAGLVLEARKYVPHVTVAYLGASADATHAAYFVGDHSLFASSAWIADRFYLYASHLSEKGSHYTVEAEYPLIG
jgi:RNA 2',3'-cyclic 3'-phosphodiesterase